MPLCIACGKQLDGNFCSNCGKATLLVPATSVTNKGRNTIAVFLGIGLFAVLLISIISASLDHSPSTSAPVSTPAPAQQAPPAVKRSTGNVAHDRLSALPAPQQAAALGTIVQEGCTGDRVFFRGQDPKTRNAFWVVHCTNGNSYGVMVHADARGSTTVLDCAVSKVFAHDDCYSRIPGTIR
jgi:hypothetical protein